MLKIFLITVTVIVSIIVFTALYLAVGFWWTARKLPPAYGIITKKYYVCYKHKALYGGIFGKGPTKQFFQPDGPDWCWRDDWEETDKEKFMQLATQWYHVNWSNESYLWSNKIPQCADLDNALRETLQSEHSDNFYSNITLEKIQSEYVNRQMLSDVPGLVLALQTPSQGITVLEKALLNEDKFIALKAASALALLGSNKGLGYLKVTQPMTNSAVELFLAKSALLILDEPVPEYLLNNKSVFLDLEDIFWQCYLLTHKNEN